MDCQTYRIEVSAKSKLYYLFIFSIFLLWLWALWLWPYYMPDSYKFCFSILLFSVFIFELKNNNKNVEKKVLLIGQNGRVIIHADYVEAGWLQPSSRTCLGFFSLSYLPELGTSAQSLVIFADQINVIERRRLSRIIRAVKFAKFE